MDEVSLISQSVTNNTDRTKQKNWVSVGGARADGTPRSTIVEGLHVFIFVGQLCYGF